jgi:hypothetical protein
MLQGLILLRDVILAILLSWIGADYDTSADAADDLLRAQKAGLSGPAPILRRLDLKPEQNTFSCSELFHS